MYMPMRPASRLERDVDEANPAIVNRVQVRMPVEEFGICGIRLTDAELIACDELLEIVS